MAGHMIRIDGLDVQDGDDPDTAEIWLDLTSGYSEPAEARGEDDVIPAASGREPGQWIRDTRRLQLSGHVHGLYGDREERAEAWRIATDLLMAKIQLHSAPVAIEVDGPYLGIPTGTTKTLNARCVRVLPGPILNRMSYQAWSLEMICIDSPPEWTDAPS